MRWPVVPMTLLIFLGSISVAWAQVQSHPLSQISPIDSNLNMYTYNSSVGYLNYSYGILSNGTQGILTADIASSAVTGSRIASNAITSSKISNPLGGLVNATAYYDSDNSNYFADLASSGTSLTTAGSVGIGTTSPTYKTEIWGDNNQLKLYSNGGTFNSMIRLLSSVSPAANWSIYDRGNDNNLWISNDANKNIILNTYENGTSSGNVGIGTSSPKSSLDVKGDQGVAVSGSNLDDAYRIFRNVATGYLHFVGNQTTFSGFRFFVNGATEAFTILNSGNVGIGTSSPSSGNGGWTRLVEIANPTDAAVVFNKSSGPVQRWVAGVNSQGYFKIYDETRPSDVFTILNGSDNIGIGTTNPGSKMTVNGGDVFVATQGNGVIIHDSDGAGCHRITVNTVGTISAASVTCPSS